MTMRWVGAVALAALVGCEGTTPSASDAGVDAVADAPPDAAVDAAVDVEADFEPDPPGQWIAGDLHVHATGASNDTGGDSHPEDIAAAARALGLGFVVLTDHSNSTGSDPTTTDEDPALFNQGPEFVWWQRAPALSEPGVFWLVSGNELSPRAPEDAVAPVGHVGCIPRTLGGGFDTVSAFVDRPMGAVTGGEAVQQALERGCFAIVNHPYALAPWIQYDWTRRDYDALEIWNGGGGGYDADDVAGRDAWRCDLLAGRAVTPVAASDNHRVHQPPPGGTLDPALGWPTTAVFAREASWAGVIEGLDAGRVALYEGASRLYLDGYDDARRRAEGEGTRVLRLRGVLDPAARAGTVRLTRAHGCDDPRPADTPPTVAEEVLIEQAVTPGEPFDLRVAIEGAVGVYSATLLTTPPGPLRGSRYAALSRAVVIAGE